MIRVGIQIDVNFLFSIYPDIISNAITLFK